MHVDEQRLLWCLLPEFDVQLARPPRRRALRARIASAILPGALRPFAKSRTREALGGLVATRSPNEERALTPIIGEAPSPRRRPSSGVPGVAAHRDSVVRVRRRIDAFLQRHNRPELRASWHHAANSTQHELQRLDRVDLSHFRFLLIARQTHPLIRALILRAEAQAVPVAYVPHSPLTDFQIDLPVSFAAVRGEAEREWLASKAGADPDRIAVVGNPATDITTEALPLLGEPSGPGVVAVSPDPEPALRRMFALLTAGGVREAIIAPHPRSDLRLLQRLLPQGWSIYQGGGTIDLLLTGPPWVVQSASGVAWESAVLGIPTADIRLDNRPPVYPFLTDESSFPALRVAEDVRAFIAAAARVDRRRLRETALRWCAEDGPQSVARIRSHLAGRLLPGPRIVDAWAEGGALVRESPLAEL